MNQARTVLASELQRTEQQILAHHALIKAKLVSAFESNAERAKEAKALEKTLNKSMRITEWSQVSARKAKISSSIAALVNVPPPSRACNKHSLFSHTPT